MRTLKFYFKQTFSNSSKLLPTFTTYCPSKVADLRSKTTCPLTSVSCFSTRHVYLCFPLTNLHYSFFIDILAYLQNGLISIRILSVIARSQVSLEQTCHSIGFLFTSLITSCVMQKFLDWSKSIWLHHYLNKQSRAFPLRFIPAILYSHVT